MAKKKRSIAKDIVVGGTGLSLGASVVGALPSSAAQVGVSKGLGTAGGFFVPIAQVGIAGGLVKQLKKLRRKK